MAYSSTHTILTPSVIAKETLMEFKNALGFVRGINRQYEEDFAVKGKKIGASISIRKPNHFVVSDGRALVKQNAVEESVTLTIDKQKHVGMEFTSKDLTLSIDEFSTRYIKPAVLALANYVDADALALAAAKSWHAVGTPGTTPTALRTYLLAQKTLNDSSAPEGDRSFTINSSAQVEIVDSLKGLFQSSEQIAEQYEKGVMGIAAGGKWRMSQGIAVQTMGARGGTPAMNGATASGATTIVTDGWTASAANRVKAGDTFTIAGVYGVNPITKASTGALQRFTAAADAASDGSGNATISVTPSIISSGGNQTVSALPADDALLTFLAAGSTLATNNILNHKDAFTLAMVDLVMPSGVEFAARASDKESGLSVRIVRQYDINEDVIATRVDVLYGLAATRPEWACRIYG